QEISVASPSVPASQARPSSGASLKSTSRWPLLRTALVLIALASACSEMRVASAARRLAATAPTLELDGLAEGWNQYDALSSRSLGFGVVRLGQALAQQTGVLGDR